MIDEQLRQAGWQADSKLMTYAKGERPEHGKNKAIAEWKISKNRADYVLFVGLMPIAIIEAKKQNKDVSGKITQAERYASGFEMDDTMLPAWSYPQQELAQTSPWQNSQTSFSVPFVYSTNGRPYFEQQEEQSGIWFRDVRKPSNIKRALQQFHSPEGLLNLLTQDNEQSNAKLLAEPLAHLGLRDYQQQAIKHIENALSCEQLANEIDPNGEEKTLIFCVTDRHADMVKRLLDEAFVNLYGDDYHEESVRKITGQSNKQDELIRLYKNEKFPSIAITVDLLTTGIDVPAICHLVFLRRVKSRILYEQMKGRATRRCDDIGKTVFKIYDPVDLCASLQAVDTMTPLVKNPNISLAQLVDEFMSLPVLANNNSSQNPSVDAQTIDEQTNLESAEQTAILDTHAKEVLDQISQKLMRVLIKANKKAEKNQKVKEKLTELQSSWGVEPTKLHQELYSKGMAYAKEFLTAHTRLVTEIAELQFLVGTGKNPIIYTGDDEFLKRVQTTDDTANSQNIDDYLEILMHLLDSN